MRYYSDTSSSTIGWTTGATYVQWYRPAPKPQPLPPQLVDAVWNAVALLDLDLPLTSREEVSRARKQLARAHHPDIGGSLELMQQINAAADLLLGGFRR